jgi:uncharacterized repeat protein (TIGR01451 family)
MAIGVFIISILPAQSPIGTSIPNIVHVVYENINNVQMFGNSNTVVTTVGPGYLLQISKAASSNYMQIDEIYTFHLDVYNGGNIAANNITVIDTLVQSINLISLSDPTAEMTGDIISWQIPQISSGNTASLDIIFSLSEDIEIGSQFSNTSFYSTPEGDFGSSNTVNIEIGYSQDLIIQHDADRTQCIPGDTLIYTIFLQNVGNAPTTNNIVYQDMPFYVEPLSISNDGIGTELISWTIGTLDPGEVFTCTVHGVVHTGAPFGEQLLSNASVTNSEGIIRNDIVIIDVTAQDPRIEIELFADPYDIPADGTSVSNISATIMYDNGDPVLDGTIAVFNTTAGFLINGMQELSLPTINGFVSLDLYSSISDVEIVTAVIIGYVLDMQNNPVQDDVNVRFHPASISGYVTDHSTELSIPNVLSETFGSDNSLVWNTNTSNDGSYFIPISSSDNFTVRNSTLDSNGNEIISENELQLILPGSQSDSHVYNHCSISGIFNIWQDSSLHMQEGVDVYLVQNAMRIDSTITNSLGQYIFNSLEPGEYAIQGLVNINTKKWLASENDIVVGNGEWLVNTNFILSPLEISLSKYASATGYTTEDTINYFIILENTTFAELNDVLVTDSLSSMLQFQSVTDGGELIGNIVNWDLGDIMPSSSDTLNLYATVKTPIDDNTLIRNVVVATSANTDDAIADNNVTISSSLSVELLKTGPLEVFPNDTLEYQLEYINTGSGVLTNVVITDQLPDIVSFIDATGQYYYDGPSHTLTWTIGALAPNNENSISLRTLVDSNIPDGMQILNSAEIFSAENIGAISSTTTTNKLPLTLDLSADPSAILGNGINNSNLTATVYSFLGNLIETPLPVVFAADEGFIPELVDTVYTFNGVAQSVLGSEVIFNETVTAIITARTEYSLTQSASDTTEVTFYPGAIVGNVINFDQNPVEGAIVELFNSDGELIGSTVSGEDGGYLVPVYTYGIFTITITIYDEFGNPVIVNQIVTISQEELNENIEIPNLVSISGWLIDGDSGLVIEEAGIPVILIGNSTGLFRSEGLYMNSVSDTTYSTETGFYTFSELQPGDYHVQVNYNGESSSGGEFTIGGLSSGTYIVNVNIILDFTDFSIFKIVDHEYANWGDTLTYQIGIVTPQSSTADTNYIVDYLPANLSFLEETLIVPDWIQLDRFDQFTNEIWFKSLISSDAVEDTIQFKAILDRIIENDNIEVVENNASFFVFGDTLYAANDPRTNATTNIIDQVLEISKTANRNAISHGDFVSYSIHIENKSIDIPFYGMVIHDLLPKGFKYIKKSSRWPDDRLVEPEKEIDDNSSLNLTWVVSDTLYPGQQLQLKYRTQAGLNASFGENTNLAFATTTLFNDYIVQSNSASSMVMLRQDGLQSKGLIIGKVYFDTNVNGIHDENEITVPGVELITESGIRVVTDSYGKYSIPNVPAGEHVIRINRRSLPELSQVINNSNDYLDDTLSKLIKMSPGGIAKANFSLKDDNLGNVNIDICSRPVMELQISKLDSIYKISSYDTVHMIFPKIFESGQATLPHEGISILNEYANLMKINKQLLLTITGHTDSLTPIHEGEFQNNLDLSIARASFIKQQLVSKYHIASDRISIEGKGDTEPIVENNFPNEIYQNRRVEMSFSHQVKDHKQPTFEIISTIEYNSNFPVADVEYHVEIPQGFSYAKNSSFLDDQFIRPSRIKDSKLIFNLGNIIGPYHHKLSLKLELESNVRLKSHNAVKAYLRYLSIDNIQVATESVKENIALQYQSIDIVWLYQNSVQINDFTQDEMNRFDLLSNIVLQNPDLKISVNGYSGGDNLSGDSLLESYHNAQNVQEYLISNYGIESKKISAFSYRNHYLNFLSPHTEMIQISVDSQNAISIPIGSFLDSNSQLSVEVDPGIIKNYQKLDFCDYEQNHIFISNHHISNQSLIYTIDEPLLIEKAILFNSASVSLSSKNKEYISAISSFMNWQKTANLIVTGYSDNDPLSGKNEYRDNFELSLRRAAAVRDMMIERFGVDPKRITITGEGSIHSIGSHGTAEEKKQNRRVDLLFEFKRDDICEDDNLNVEFELESTNFDKLNNSQFKVTTPPGFIYQKNSSIINDQIVEPDNVINSIISWSIPDNLNVGEKFKLNYQLQAYDIESINDTSLISGLLDNINYDDNIFSFEKITDGVQTQVFKNMFTTVIESESLPNKINEGSNSLSVQVVNTGRFLEWEKSTLLTIECWINDESKLHDWNPQFIREYLISNHDVEVDRIRIMPVKRSEHSLNRIHLIIGSEFKKVMPDFENNFQSSRYDVIPKRKDDSFSDFNKSMLLIEPNKLNHLFLSVNYSILQNIDSLTISLTFPKGSFIQKGDDKEYDSSIMWKIDNAQFENPTIYKFSVIIPELPHTPISIYPTIEAFLNERIIQIESQNEIIITD